jgi:hypothetical protein
MAKFCSECGAKIEPGVKFCSECGAKLDAPAAAAAPQRPAPVQQQPQSQSSANLSEKERVLRDAPGALNKANQPWQVRVEGDSIIATWKWMDATFFGPTEVNQETRDYAFTVTLTDKKTWSEKDKSQESSSKAKIGAGGKLSLGTSSSTFIGKQSKKSFELGAGKNNQTGEVGIIKFKFDTKDVKEPVRAYLTHCGWKKAGLLGK